MLFHWGRGGLRIGGTGRILPAVTRKQAEAYVKHGYVQVLCSNGRYGIKMRLGSVDGSMAVRWGRAGGRIKAANDSHRCRLELYNPKIHFLFDGGAGLLPAFRPIPVAAFAANRILHLLKQPFYLSQVVVCYPCNPYLSQYLLLPFRQCP